MEGVKIANHLEKNKLKALNFCLEQQDKARKPKILLECYAFVAKFVANIKVNLEDKMEVWKEYEEKVLYDEEKEWSEELNFEKMKNLVKKCW